MNSPITVICTLVAKSALPEATRFLNVVVVLVSVPAALSGTITVTVVEPATLSSVVGSLARATM